MKQFDRCIRLRESKRRKTAKKNHNRAWKMLCYAVDHYGGIPTLRRAKMDCSSEKCRSCDGNPDQLCYDCTWCEVREQYQIAHLEDSPLINGSATIAG